MSAIEYAHLQNMIATAPYAHMTFRLYAKRLSVEYPRWNPVVIAACAENTPVGLALVQPEEGSDLAELLSVSVDEKYRHRGIATELLRRAEDACMDRGVRLLDGHYMTDEASTAALERVLAKRGFEPPAPRMLAVRCSLDSISHAPWIRQYKLPARFEIVPWVEVTEAEREHIRQSHAQAPWIAEDLMPFSFEADLEPVTSLALRVRGEVRGWVINHVVEGMLRFTCSYMHPEQQKLGRILLLYNEAVRRMPSVNLSVGMWTVPFHHAGMVAFARRWMQPYSVYFGETRGVRKVLGGAAP
jgi:GNAT superfamily N-acetyltransferase